MPMAVAIKASPMGPATTSRLAEPAWLMSCKACMMPHTVPNRPTKGEVLPTLARIDKPCSKALRSLLICWRRQRSRISCTSPLSCNMRDVLPCQSASKAKPAPAMRPMALED